MKPLEFLADVLPPAGMGAYCVVGILNQRRTHFFTDDLSAALYSNYDRFASKNERFDSERFINGAMMSWEY